jgi:hypothetical protein
VTLERRRHMKFVRRIALGHSYWVIILWRFRRGRLCDRTRRCTHLAALDQVGVRFEDRTDLIRRRHLFAVEHGAFRSCPCLGVIRTWSGLRWRSTRAWIFVVSPPRAPPLTLRYGKSDLQ